MRVWVVLVTTWKVLKRRKIEVKDTRARVFPTKKAAEAWAEAQDWGIWREYAIQECQLDELLPVVV